MSEKRSNTGPLEFEVPESGVFPDQAVHSYSVKLLKTEISRANEDRKRFEEMLVKARSLVQKKKSTNSGGHQFSAS